MHLAETLTLEAEQLAGDTQLIPRHDWPAEPYAINSCKNKKSLWQVGHLSHDQTTDLSHGLNNQDSRHQWPTREMTLELRFIESDIFDCYSPLTGLMLQNPVHQRKGIAGEAVIQATLVSS